MGSRGIAVLAVALSACGRFDFSAPSDAGFDTRPDANVDLDALVKDHTVVRRYETTMHLAHEEITIEPVDPSRTFITCDVHTESSDLSYLPTCDLLDALTLGVDVGTPDDPTTVVIQTIQLPVGNHVQRGTVQWGSNKPQLVIPIDPVDTAHAFPLLTRWTNIDSDAFDQRIYGTADLASSKLTIDRDRTGNTVHLAWQVVEMPTASVQPIAITMQVGNASNGIYTRPDNNPAFVVDTVRTTSGEEAENLLRLEVGDTQVSAFRNTSLTQLDASAYLVEMPGSTVTSGTLVPGADVTVNAVQAIPLLDRTSVFLSFSGGTNGDTDTTDDVFATPLLTADGITLTRPSSVEDVNSAVTYSIVEWP
ncbi:MAG TPA: hypothetical protein VGM39_17205 [Kofleriaceae bacterium]|jgi:hypothetical protein